MNQSPDDPGCQESMQWGLFLDGHLDEGEGQALAEHLNQCERCQNLVAARVEIFQQIFAHNQTQDY